MNGNGTMHQVPPTRAQEQQEVEPMEVVIEEVPEVPEPAQPPISQPELITERGHEPILPPSPQLEWLTEGGESWSVTLPPSQPEGLIIGEERRPTPPPPSQPEGLITGGERESSPPPPLNRRQVVVPIIDMEEVQLNITRLGTTGALQISHLPPGVQPILTLHEIVDQACSEEEFMEEAPPDAAGGDHAQGQPTPEPPKEETPPVGASVRDGCPNQH